MKNLIQKVLGNKWVQRGLAVPTLASALAGPLYAAPQAEKTSDEWVTVSKAQYEAVQQGATGHDGYLTFPTSQTALKEARGLLDGKLRPSVSYITPEGKVVDAVEQNFGYNDGIQPTKQDYTNADLNGDLVVDPLEGAAYLKDAMDQSVLHSSAPVKVRSTLGEIEFENLLAYRVLAKADDVLYGVTDPKKSMNIGERSKLQTWGEDFYRLAKVSENDAGVVTLDYAKDTLVRTYKAVNEVNSREAQARNLQ